MQQNNKYVANLNRIEFLVTFACTGRCRHCSEGEHSRTGTYIDVETAAKLVRDVTKNYAITSLMTFGGEPLLYPEVVYAIQSAAIEARIPKRQLITNGFFSKDSTKIKAVAEMLAKCGVNDVLLSVDAFHQETIPLEPVKEFAFAVKNFGVPLRVHPAWLVSKEHDNPYNCRTAEILSEFEAMGISQSDGNIIFPSGNALKYLTDYFDTTKEYVSPYLENPSDVRTICVAPNGNVLDGNVYESDIMQILEKYEPKVSR